ncbi:MAG: Na+/melibiose symporter and related transporter-like protein [Alphaproteobacteria bacterium]|nr:MAG: Na+/melibiose symporter and related transporter-like protein [Alphaproteobacteria bacterium]
MSQNISKLSLESLLSYSGLAVPMSMLLLPVIIYLPPFYAENLGLSLSAVGGTFFLARLWDGISDPVIGSLSDRLNSRWGRRKPWIAVGAPLLMVATYFLCVPTQTADDFYLLFWLVAFYLAWTMVQIPFQSWGAELTPDYHERNRLVGFREGGFMLGILLAVGVPMIFLPPEPDLRNILQIFTAVVLILIPITVVIALKNVPDVSSSKGEYLKLRAVPRTLVRNRPFLRVMSAYFIYQVGSAAWDALVVFTVTRYMGLSGGLFLSLVLFQYLAAIICIPLAVRLANKIGKHRAICVGILIRPLAFGLIVLVSPEGYLYAALSFALLGVAGAPMLVLPTSIVADVIDYDTLKTGKRQTGTYMSLFNLGTKLALALGVGIALPLVDLAGFDPTGENTASAMSALIIVGCGMPVLLALVSLTLLWNFSITEKKHDIIRRWLSRAAARKSTLETYKKAE